MLQNEHIVIILAKIGFDTADNEPRQVCCINIARCVLGTRRSRRCVEVEKLGQDLDVAQYDLGRWQRGFAAKDLQSLLDKNTPLS